MGTRMAAITVCAAAWLIAGSGYAAATPTTGPGEPIVLAQESGDQLTPQNPGAPSATTGDTEYQSPRTGGVRWEDFGGDPADAPQSFDSFVDSVLGWLKTIAGVAAVLGLITIATLMALGMRGRSEMARKALDGVWPVLLGTVVAGSAWTIVSAFAGS